MRTSECPSAYHGEPGDPYGCYEEDQARDADRLAMQTLGQKHDDYMKAVDKVVQRWASLGTVKRHDLRATTEELWIKDLYWLLDQLLTIHRAQGRS